MQTEYEIVDKESVSALRTRVNQMLHDEKPWQIIGGMAVLALRDGPRFYQAMIRFQSKIITANVASKATFPAAGNGNSVKANKPSAA